jgi:hypothetical protein
MGEQNDSQSGGARDLELEQMKRPQLVEVAAHYNVTLLPGMSNVQAVAAIRAAAVGYQPQQSRQGDERPQQSQESGQVQESQELAIEYVMMRRITDGDGPHPIHPDEVENYRRGDWVEVEAEPQD